MTSQTKIHVQELGENQEELEQEKQELKRSKARQEVRSKPTPIFHFLLFGSKIAAGPPFNVKYQNIWLCQSNI